jgi:hypothetical protein
MITAHRKHALYLSLTVVEGVSRDLKQIDSGNHRLRTCGSWNSGKSPNRSSTADKERKVAFSLFRYSFFRRCRKLGDPSYQCATHVNTDSSRTIAVVEGLREAPLLLALEKKPSQRDGMKVARGGP